MVDHIRMAAFEDLFGDQRGQVTFAQVGGIHVEQGSEFRRGAPAPVLEYGDNDRTQDLLAGPGPQCHDPAVEVQGELLPFYPGPPVRPTGSDRRAVRSSYQSAFRRTWLGSSRLLVIAPQ